MAAALLLIPGVAWAEDGKNTDLELRATPRVSLAPPGSFTPILLTAEIVGPETERYYCPEVVWTWPDGTHSSEESDCDPFEERTHYPRRFTRRIGAYAFPTAYRVCVSLRKAGEILDRSCVHYTVR
jgi:hypothetical protein